MNHEILKHIQASRVKLLPTQISNSISHLPEQSIDNINKGKQINVISLKPKLKGEIEQRPRK